MKIWSIILLLLSSFHSHVLWGECLPFYKRIEQSPEILKTLTKKEIKSLGKMEQLLIEVSHPEDGQPKKILSTLHKRIKKIPSHEISSEKELAILISHGNKMNIFCKEGQDLKKLIPYSKLKKDFLKLRNQIEVHKLLHHSQGPKNFLRHLQEKKITPDEDLIGVFLTMKERPSLEDAIAMSKLVKGPVRIVQWALDNGLVKTQNNYHLVYDQLKNETITQLLNDHFLKQNPYPTADQILGFAKLQETTFDLLNKAYNKLPNKRPQDLLTYFGHLKNITFSDKFMDGLLEKNPAPTIAEVVAISKILKSPVDFINMAYGKKYVKKPQDLIDLYGHLGKVKFTDQTINAFFSHNPSPTIAEVVALSKIHSDLQQILNTAYNRNYVKKPKDLIDLFGHLENVNFLDSTINYFFAVGPSPTIAEVVALSKISSDKNKILNIAYNKNYVKKPQDLFSLFGHLRKVNFLDSTIKTFFSFNPGPTIEEIAKLANIHDDKSAIINYARDNSFIHSPEEFLVLYDDGNNVSLDKDDVVKFFSFNRLPTLNQIARLLNTYKKSPLKREIVQIAMEVLPLENSNDLLDVLVHQLPLTKNEEKVKFIDDIIKFLQNNHNNANFIPGDWNKFKSFVNNELGKGLQNQENLDYLLALINSHMDNNGAVLIKNLGMEVAEENASEACSSSESLVHYYILEKNLDQVMKKIQASSSSQTPELCTACMEDIPSSASTGTSSFSCPHCPMKLCQGCFKQTMGLKIQERKIPISCDNCKHEVALTSADWKTLGPKMEEEYPKVKRESVLRYHKHRFPQAKNCQTPDCLYRIQEKHCDSSSKHYTCKFCANSYCFQCGDKHKGISCEANQKRKGCEKDMEALLATGQFRKCFHCNSLIEKTEGCNRVMCPGCQKNNLWDPNSNVLKEWHGYDHHNATGETWKGVKK